MLVFYFLSYLKMYVVVLYGFFEIPQTPIRIAKIAKSVTLPMLVSYFYSFFKM